MPVELFGTTIDSVLDAYTATKFSVERYRWWWNACDVIAEALASAFLHVRDDGCHALTEAELSELSTLARYMEAFAADNFDGLTVRQEAWLHAESMWLLGRWFSRLWD